MDFFDTARCAVAEARRADIPAMQAFFEANPAFTLLVEGRAVAPDAAEIEFDEAPPAEMGYDRHWTLLARERGGETVVGVIAMVKDLLAPGIWHLGLFWIAERLHGTGIAAELYAATEDWAIRGGARWLRLGVVERNVRGARFWRRQGYRFVAAREAAAAGGRVNTVWCLVKTVGANTLADYLAAQRRDAMQPEPAGWRALAR